MSKLLTSNQVAEMLGLSNQTMRTSRTTGRLWDKKAPDYLKMGRTVRYELETVEAWIEQFKQEGTQ